MHRRLSRELRSENGNEDDDDDEEPPDTSRNHEPGMSFQAKISSWLAGCGGTSTNDAGRPENHQGAVEEQLWEDWMDLFDYDELPELSRYRQILTQSFAYRWLISTLQARRGLAVPEGQPSVQSQISRSIVEKLRPGNKFSRNDMSKARLCFQLDWNFEDFYREQRYGVPIEEVLERAVTLTGHGNDVQVCTCLEYMSQTWPETSLALLKFLQRVFRISPDTEGQEARPRFHFDTLPGETLILAPLFPLDGIMVKLVGDAFAIAEIGEQLAWLGAALRSATTEAGLMSCTPYIQAFQPYSVPRIEYGSSIPVNKVVCCIGFRLAEAPADFSGQGSCWRALFRNPVMVDGYPIPRNPTPGSGAQVPLDISGALINSDRFVKWAGTTFIKGFSAILVATKVVGETILWHLVHNEDGSYISHTDPRVPRWPESADPFVLESMAHFRHVVGWCDKIISHAGMPPFRNSRSHNA